jgi:hypothetical protein
VVSPSFQGDFLSAVGPAGSDLYLGGGGAALRSSDSGRTWSQVITPAFAAGTTYVAIAATAEDDVWLAGSNPASGAKWVHSADRGSSWQPIDVGSYGSPGGIWSIDRTSVLITTGDGQIRKTVDAGATWAPVFSDPSLSLGGLWGSAASADLYAVGGGMSIGANPGAPGVILHSADGGDTWQPILGGLACALWSVSGTSDGANISAAGDCGTVAISTDHGATWSTSGVNPPPKDYAITGVWVSPTGTSYFLPAGSGFEVDPFGPYLVCQSVQVTDTGNGGAFAATAGCEPLPPYTDGQGSSATSSPTAIWGTSDDDIWVTGLFLWHRG